MAAAWLSVTVEARSRPDRLRACGTFPWTAATTAVGVPGGCWSTGSRAPTSASPAAPANASRGSARRRSPARRPGTSRAQARVVPASATRKLSSGAPPTAAHGAAGVPAWLIASLPHGNAYGHRLRSASAHTHQPATASGQARRSSSNRWPTASSAKITASATASANHAYHATLSSQDSSGTKKASPNTSPASSEARRPRRHSATASSAGPAGASGQIPIGGKAAVRASPPVSATASAQGRLRRAAAAGPRGPGTGGLTVVDRRPVAAGLRVGGPRRGGRAGHWSPARARAGRGSRAGAPGRRARSRPHRPRRRSPSPFLPPVGRPCLWAHTAACEGNRATGSRRPRPDWPGTGAAGGRIAGGGNAAARSLADLQETGPVSDALVPVIGA